MKTLIFAVFLCVVMAVNAGAVWSEESILHYPMLVGSSDPSKREIINQNANLQALEREIKQLKKGKPQFYKVIGEDIRIRANEIEAWKIEKGYIEKKDIPLGQCEAKGFYKEWTVCVPTTQSQGDWLCNYVCAERKWTIRAKYEGCWHDIKVFKTRQQAKNWLDRQAP